MAAKGDASAIIEAFKSYDTTNSGAVSLANMRRALSAVNISVSALEAASLASKFSAKAHDATAVRGGSVDYQQLVRSGVLQEKGVFHADARAKATTVRFEGPAVDLTVTAHGGAPVVPSVRDSHSSVAQRHMDSVAARRFLGSGNVAAVMGTAPVPSDVSLAAATEEAAAAVARRAGAVVTAAGGSLQGGSSSGSGTGVVVVGRDLHGGVLTQVGGVTIYTGSAEDTPEEGGQGSTEAAEDPRYLPRWPGEKYAKLRPDVSLWHSGEMAHLGGVHGWVAQGHGEGEVPEGYMPSLPGYMNSSDPTNAMKPRLATYHPLYHTGRLKEAGGLGAYVTDPSAVPAAVARVAAVHSDPLHHSGAIDGAGGIASYNKDVGPWLQRTAAMQARVAPATRISEIADSGGLAPPPEHPAEAYRPMRSSGAARPPRETLAAITKAHEGWQAEADEVEAGRVAALLAGARAPPAGKANKYGQEIDEITSARGEGRLGLFSPVAAALAANAAAASASASSSSSSTTAEAAEAAQSVRAALRAVLPESATAAAAVLRKQLAARDGDGDGCVTQSELLSGLANLLPGLRAEDAGRVSALLSTVSEHTDTAAAAADTAADVLGGPKVDVAALTQWVVSAPTAGGQQLSGLGLLPAPPPGAALHQAQRLHAHAHAHRRPPPIPPSLPDAPAAVPTRPRHLGLDDAAVADLADWLPGQRHAAWSTKEEVAAAADSVAETLAALRTHLSATASATLAAAPFATTELGEPDDAPLPVTPLWSTLHAPGVATSISSSISGGGSSSSSSSSGSGSQSYASWHRRKAALASGYARGDASAPAAGVKLGVAGGKQASRKHVRKGGTDADTEAGGGSGPNAPVPDARFAAFRANWENRHGGAAAKEMAADLAVPAEGPTWSRAAPQPFKVVHLAAAAPPPPLHGHRPAASAGPRV